MKQIYSALFIVSVAFLNSAKCDRILFFWAETSYSHRVAVWPLVEALSARGHDVTFLSPFPPKKPNSNVTEFMPQLLVKYLTASIVEFDAYEYRASKGKSSICDEALAIEGYDVCDSFLSSPETSEWVKNSKFDLIIIDALLNECALGLAVKFNAPFIIYATSSFYLWHLEELGLPDEHYWIPNGEATSEMTFGERLDNMYEALHCHFMRTQKYLPKLEELIKEKLDLPNLPNLLDLQRNLSLIFVNSHPSFDYARSVSPIVVPVGGMHLNDADIKSEPLPDNLQKFIAGSGKTGFILVSFGTWIEVNSMPIQVRRALMDSLAAFPNLRFIWKWKGDKPADGPENVLFAEWVPQRAVLAHPKIRAFITHSGLLSVHESIHYGVPLICFPIFGDQNYNAEHVRRLGLGIKLEIVGLTTDTLVTAISSVLGNKEFQRNAKEVATNFKDRPMQALEVAVWWTEFVLRHKGQTSFLRPQSIHTNWFYRRSLDIWLFIFTVVIVLGFTLIAFLRCLLRFIFSSHTGESGKGKMKKH